MASIVFRNSSRRLLRAYFSKLGWLANVIWRIAFFNQLQVYPSWLWRSDLFRASLNLRSSLCGYRRILICDRFCYGREEEYVQRASSLSAMHQGCFYICCRRWAHHEASVGCLVETHAMISFVHIRHDLLRIEQNDEMLG